MPTSLYTSLMPSWSLFLCVFFSFFSFFFFCYHFRFVETFTIVRIALINKFFDGFSPYRCVYIPDIYMAFSGLLPLTLSKFTASVTAQRYRPKSIQSESYVCEHHNTISNKNDFNVLFRTTEGSTYRVYLCK